MPTVRSKRALARHVRAAHDQDAGDRSQCDVVPDTVPLRDQRMAERLGFIHAGSTRRARGTGRRDSPPRRRQGAEGLELADGVDPAGDVRTRRPRQASIRMASWVVQSQRAASGMKNWLRRGIEQVQQPGEPADPRARPAGPRSRAIRRAVAGGVPGRARAPGGRAAPRAAPGRASAGRRRPGPIRTRSRRSARGSPSIVNTISSGSTEVSNDEPADQRGGGQDRQDDRDDQGKAPPWKARGHDAPGGQRVRVDAGPDLGAEQLEVLAQVESRAAVRRPPRDARRSAAGIAGASSHEASAASPARVRAVQSRSNIEPRPNRSRSAA